MAEETKLEPKPKTAKQQAHIDKVLKPRAFKPGESGNPLGRLPGLKSVTALPIPQHSAFDRYIKAKEQSLLPPAEEPELPPGNK
jgi:hypothetical protein